MQPTHIFVTAADGREVPIPPSEGSAPGASLLRVVPGKTYRVRYSTFTRRRLAAGDLVLVNRGGTKVTELDQANAPEDVITDEFGALVQHAHHAPEHRARRARSDFDHDETPIPSDTDHRKE